MFRSAIAPVVAFLLAFLSATSDAKVIRLYNPWLSYGSELVGKIRLINYFPMTGWTDTGSANVFKQSNGAWLELVVPDGTIPVGVVNFTVNVTNGGPPYSQSFGTTGIGGGDMDLGTPLTTSDTVWIVPTPLPNGPATVLTTAPKEITVMLWNPFEYDVSAQRPSMRVGTNGWKAMDTVRNALGWYSSYTIGFANLALLFRNADSTKFFGAAGVGLPATAVFDSLVPKNDTIWIWSSPEPNGVPKASAVFPKMRTIMLMNPWDGLLPFQRPLIDFGAGAMPMRPEPTYCGWLRFAYIDRAPQVHFVNARTAATLGSTGFGSITKIDLSQAFTLSDTAWVTTAIGTGVPTVFSAYTGEQGMCEISFLAATVRDFDSTHGDFEEGSTNNCGLVKGMIAPTLGPDRKPLLGPNRCRLSNNSRRVVDSGLTTQWFRDVPSVNSTTCRDIPLAINDETGNYFYDDTAYFPIDDFTTLADGSPNPRYKTITSYVDNKKHNYHYCLESHGEFEYKKGQKFAFRGDDDVWFFIDNRLVVDLGGVHNPAQGSVLLDTMGLVEDRTYTFDFFYCERQSVGANMRIETSMNLRTPSGFRIFDTLRSPGITSFDLYVSQKLGQGCSSGENVQKTAGRFMLSGPQIVPPLRLPSGISYGGITIDATLGRLVLDTTKLTGLAPGTYTIRILPTGSDTTGSRSITFVIPMNARPYFQAKPAYTGLKGTSLPVRVVSRTISGVVDPLSVVFVLHPIPGLRYFRDSLQTSEILPGDTLVTGANGIPRVLWVRGDSVGEYTLHVGFTGKDTVDTYPGISFQDRLLRYIDAAGVPLLPVPAIDRDVRTSVQVYIEVAMNGSTCITCKDTILLSGSPSLEFRGAATGAPISQVVLVNGRASFWVYGSAPLSQGTFRAAYADGGGSAPWSPVTFRAPVLRFQDSLGVDLPAVVGDVLVPRKVWLEARGMNGVCVDCNQSVRFATTDSEVIVSAIPSGPQIGSINLVGGRTAVWIVSRATISLLPLYATSDSLWAADTLLLTFTARPPDSAYWSDVNGDGSVDQLVVYLALPWRSNSSVTASWPDSAPLVGLDASKLSLSPDSMVATWTLVPGLSPLVTQGPSSRGSLNWDGRTSLGFPIGERVAPVPLRALLRYGVGSDIDTVRIPWSEVVSGSFASGDELVVLQHAGTWKGARPMAAIRDLAAGALLLLYRSDDSTQPVPGDSLRFSPSGALRDMLGNVPGVEARKVVIQGTDRAPYAAVMKDANGDGRADQVVLRFRAMPSVTRNFEFAWSGPSGRESRIMGIDSARQDSAGRILTFNLPPFTYGWTGCPATGCLDLGAMISIWGTDTARVSFPVQDGVAPVPVLARLRYGSDAAGPDTLIVTLGEPVKGGGEIASPWFSYGQPSRDPVGEVVPWTGMLGGGVLSPDGLTATFLVDTSFKGGKGDSVRATAQSAFGTVSDTLGNRPGTPSGWVPLEVGPHPMFLIWKPMPAVRKYDGWDPPPGEPAMQVLVRDPVTGDWKNIDGSKPSQDTSHYGGIYLKFNRAMKGSAYLYDNLGIYVADVSLEELAQAIQSSGLKPDSRGNYEVWLAWNGTSMGVVAKGKAAVAPSGVYLFRVIAHYKEEGREVLLNRLFKSGWKR